MGFRKGFQTADIQFVAQQTIEKVSHQGERVCACEADIYKAYDRVKWVACLRALRRRLPKEVALAYMREVMRHTKRYEYGTMLITKPIQPDRGLLQG